MGLIAWFFPRSDISAIQSVWFEIVALPTVFFAMYLTNDPVTTPSRRSVKCLYAFTMGLTIMLFRHTGGYQMTAVFVVLLMNGITPIFEMSAEYVARIVRRNIFDTQKNYKQAAFDQEEDTE